MNRKRMIALLLGLALCLGCLAGCSGPASSAPASQPPAASGSEAAPAGDGQTYEMVIALHTNEGTIECQAMDRFKEAVEQASGGRLQVTIFPGATVGTEEENLEQIRVNEIQGSIFGDVMTSQLAADLDPTVTPFLFTNIDDVLEVWGGEIGEQINQACIEAGNIRVLGVGRRGARYLYTNREITAPDQLKGLKLRIPAITNWVTLWESMGALATPISFSEVYTSLQTGVVDAFECPLELAYSGSYFEVIKYAMKTEHLYGLFHLGVSESWLRSLPEDLQQLIIEEGAKACAWGDEQMASYEAEMAKALQDKGVTIVEVDKDVFVQAAMPAIREISQQWQPSVQQAMEQYMQ